MRVYDKKFRFLICSGPTQEPMDPVRFISNYSTGTMGKCLKNAAQKRGHRVTWVSCPKDAGTARQLLKKLAGLVFKHDALIMAAAVSDVRPAFFSSHKIKKSALNTVRLVKNPDILAVLSKRKKHAQAFVGFALESKNGAANAIKKLKEKKLDLIVLQHIAPRNTPFGNKVIGAVVFEGRNKWTAFKSTTKAKLAGFLVRKTEQILVSKKSDSTRGSLVH